MREKPLIINRQFKINVWFCCVSHRMCGYYSPSEPLTFLSSRNVMLVTMVTDNERNFPGFRAQVSQIKRGSRGKNYLVTETHEPFCHRNCLKVGHRLTFFCPFVPETTCGGQLTGEKGRFTSPNFPNYYPPRTTCEWLIQVRCLLYGVFLHKSSRY